MRECEQALHSTTAERMRWGKEVSTKKLYGGEWTAGPLSAVNNSSGPAALTELKVKIQAEPESDFLLQHSRKLYGRECYWLHITSQALYAQESFRLLALLTVHHTRHHNPSQQLYC